MTSHNASKAYIELIFLIKQTNQSNRGGLRHGINVCNDDDGDEGDGGVDGGDVDSQNNTDKTRAGEWLCAEIVF